jgi:hypothetical protein
MLGPKITTVADMAAHCDDIIEDLAPCYLTVGQAHSLVCVYWLREGRPNSFFAQARWALDLARRVLR